MVRSIFFDPSWYSPERHGSLEAYLTIHDGHTAFPLFQGYEHFKMLWDRGYLEPGMSALRLMWNLYRDDEHFLVLSEHQLRGLDHLSRHAGRSGDYDPRVLLSAKTCPPWEAHPLNRKPLPRTSPS